MRNIFFGAIKKNKILHLLLLLGTLNLIIFAIAFGFRSNNDTDSFIWTIERFRGIESNFYVSRYLNPFYPIIGATLLRFVSPAHVIIILNIFFYYGLIFLTYDLIQRVFKNKIIGFLSALFVSTSYPMIRYGLTQVQDIGGYFWFVLTVYAGWRWWEEDKNKWLYLGGLAVGLGMLTKESGSMGALFCGILFLVKKINLRKKVQTFLKFSILPLIVLIINQYNGYVVGYSSGEWFMYNWKTYSEFNYTFFKWASINASTFNFLWILVLVGSYYLYKNRKQISPQIKLYLLAVIPSSASYFAWPLFLSRTVFVCAWLVIPVAVYGVWNIYESGKKKIAIVLCAVALVFPYALQSFLGYTPVFLIIDQTCHFNPSCIIETFQKSRTNFDNFILNSQNFIEK